MVTPDIILQVSKVHRALVEYVGKSICALDAVHTYAAQEDREKVGNEVAAHTIEVAKEVDALLSALGVAIETGALDGVGCGVVDNVRALYKDLGRILLCLDSMIPDGSTRRVYECCGMLGPPNMCLRELRSLGIVLKLPYWRKLVSVGRSGYELPLQEPPSGFTYEIRDLPSSQRSFVAKYNPPPPPPQLEVTVKGSHDSEAKQSK